MTQTNPAAANALSGISSILGSFRIVLVAPRVPGNIGAVARLTANYECPDWVLVDPRCDWKSWDGRKLATGPARENFENVQVFGTLHQALEDCHAAVGFTRRQGRARRPSVLLPGVPGLPAAAKGKIALVFGNEETGLSSDELVLCSHTCALPVSDAMGSLNLSHAVSVVLSRLFEIATEAECALPLRREARGKRFKPAPLAEVGAMLAHWSELLVDIGMTRGGNPERLVLTLKRIFDRAALTEQELRAIRGVLSKAQVRLGTRSRGKRQPARSSGL